MYHERYLNMAIGPINNYPNITWEQFAVCNDDKTTAFEDLSRQLFYYEFIKQTNVPHSNHNNPGVEVDPELEPVHEDGSKRRRVSFQAKYFENSIQWGKFRESSEKAVQNYEGKLDHIYLFCNKTITKSSDGYKSVERILSKKGITLQPVSNKDILNLIHKYPNIANYFFLHRVVAYDLSGINSHSMNISIITENGQEPPNNITYVALTEELLPQKIEECHRMYFSLQLIDLSQELEKLLSHDLKHFNGTDCLYIYQFLIKLREGNDIDIYIPSDFQNEAKWLQNYCKNPYPVIATEFTKHCPEVQVFLIDKMFTSQLWEAIIKLYRSKIITDERVKKQLEFHAGLSFFNLCEFNQASGLFHNLSDVDKCARNEFFALCSDIQLVVGEFRCGIEKHIEKLISLLDTLSIYKDNYFYKVNEAMVALLYLEGYSHLGCRYSKYLGKAFAIFETFSDEVKNNDHIRFRLGICHELNEDLDEAIRIYAGLNWKSDEFFAQRYISSLVLAGENKKALEVYQLVEEKTPRVVGVYLWALYRSGNKDFKTILQNEIDKYKNSAESVFLITFYLEDKSSFDEIIFPVLVELTDAGFTGISDQTKAGLAILFAKWKRIELIDKTLASFDDLSVLDSLVINIIYESCLEVINKNFREKRQRKIIDIEMDSANRIAERMLEAGLARERFLQIRIGYSRLLEMKLSMLRYSKEFFEITHDENTARNIIMLLFERNISDLEEYQPYVDFLKLSKEPEYCLAVAYALSIQGKIEEADYFAYKAFYYLNDRDDFDIYKYYLGYYYSYLSRYNEQSKNAKVVPNTVVKLEKIDCPGEFISLCLDSETEFNDPNNKSLGVNHCPNSSLVYNKLIGGRINQNFKINEKSYRLVEVLPRYIYVGRFVFSKIYQFPEQFKDSVKIFSARDPKNIIEQIKRSDLLQSSTRQTKTLLRIYSREDGGIGLPIDALIQGNYSRYIDAMKMLLFSKDQVFLSGYPTVVNFDESKFVPTISTLLFASLMGWMNLIKGIKDRIVIPESYISFFQEQYSRAKEMEVISPGSMTVEDGKILFFESDKNQSAIWEAVVEFCENIEIIAISDAERITFELFDNFTGEQFFAQTGIHLIQLDALILSKKLNAQYLCDDFFFNQLADYIKIKRINFASLLYHLPPETCTAIAMDLSKTNYIHTPFLPSTEEFAIQMYENLMTGEKKKQYYTDFFIRYINVFSQDTEDIISTDEIENPSDKNPE